MNDMDSRATNKIERRDRKVANRKHGMRVSGRRLAEITRNTIKKGASR